jgi:hypothetical protein
MAMKDKKKVICILVAAILILCTGICSYRLGQTSIETPEKYLQTHFTEPQVHYSKELVTVSSGNYLIVFYYNDSHTIVAAVFECGDWQYIFRRTSGTLYPQGENVSSMYPILYSGIPDINKQIIWGCATDQNINEILVDEKQAVIVKTGNITLWVRIVDLTAQVPPVRIYSNGSLVREASY